MLKSAIRKLYKEKRKALSDAEKDKLEDLILIQFQRSGISVPENILSYAFSAQLDELDPSLIMRYCQFIQPGSVFHFPVIDGSEMHAVAVNHESEFRMNGFGIEEPANGIPADPAHIDLVIVPLLAFDKNGHRVGFGKGYYDRFLRSCRPDCIKMGLSYFEPVDSIDDLDNFDVPLNFVITPAECYNFI